MAPSTSFYSLALIALVVKTAAPFVYSTPFVARQLQQENVQKTALFDGSGVANAYSWNEDAVELEIRVKVPANTRAKDIQFQAKPLSVDLRLLGEEPTLLLDGNRTMRGRVAMDGTFWNLEDMDDSEERQIVVTIEKNIRTTRDDYEVVDYDWGGVYPEDEEEVVSKKYAEPEEMDIREYAASMGVDIDNINMSLVDKTMFTSGLNMTKSTMDQLSKSGYVQEVTQQADGTEFTVDPETGDSVPFSPYGETISQEEARAAKESPQIPFLDTESPWSNAAPPPFDIDEMLKNIDTGPAASSKGAVPESPMPKDTTPLKSAAPPPAEDEEAPASPLSDPIDRLTVSRLKEILREQGLKVSGNKADLQQRLREHVKSQLATE
jgi:hypothetical protein